MWTTDLSKLNLNPTSTYYKWLSHSTALSTELKKSCKELTVSIKIQYIGAAHAEEQRALNIKEDNSFIREVFLCGDNMPWVHARTIVPNATYMQHKEEFDTLGTKLLGEAFLYKYTNLKRDPFSFMQVTPDENIYARRSVFYLEKSPLMVTETFLSTIPKYESAPSMTYCM